MGGLGLLPPRTRIACSGTANRGRARRAISAQCAILPTLPGIGRYTAGAIASIAFDQRAPILEANTIRLFTRLIGYCEDPTKSAGQKLLWQTAEDLLPRKSIAHFNQALMELGSLVCKPNNPNCESCPVASLCVTNELGAQASIPMVTNKLKFTDVNEAAVVVRKNDQVLVRRCTEDERWAGLWDFPRFAIESEGPLFVRDELVAKVEEQTGVTIDPGGLLTTIKHGVTRFRITLDCYEAKYSSARLKKAVHADTTRWCCLAELDELPLSSTGRKLANVISN